MATKDITEKQKREKLIKGIKSGGSLLMYIGSAGLMNPIIRDARQNQSGPMKICSFGAGAILSLGLGSLASKCFDKVVDKTFDFYDDVKPKVKKTITEEKEDNA